MAAPLRLLPHHRLGPCRPPCQPTLPNSPGISLRQTLLCLTTKSVGPPWEGRRLTPVAEPQVRDPKPSGCRLLMPSPCCRRSAIGERLAAFFLPWRERYSLSPVSGWRREHPRRRLCKLRLDSALPQVAVASQLPAPRWVLESAASVGLTPTSTRSKQAERAERAEGEHSEFVKRLKERMVEGARAGARA